MMRNYLCWDPGTVRQVINPFAEHITDSLFRAVHSDWDLKVSPPVGKSFQDIGEAAWADMSQPTFLEDFLREDRPHALAAILGETGSGKSHLVHWMRLNIKPTKNRVVLVVPKSGTSLRNIVKMIIDELPPEQQAGFLETLQSAGDGTQSRNDQKQQLLNDLAQAIREEVLPVDAEEIEQELIATLPDLFQDPYMRQAHFLGDSTVISEIVDHIFAQSNAQDRPDQRREFVKEDLPLGGLDFVAASTPAKNAMRTIDLDPPSNLPLAIDIINRNLNRAIARTLSFSGDRVEELMARLRGYLKLQNKELLLLVEEFARLQGIDRALLQAITSQGDEQQCKIRTAIAVTTGFFQSVAETAYMRTTHVVDMDRSAGRVEGRSVTQDSLSQFTARYLNAVRLGPDAIGQWNETAAASERPKSKCDDCLHQSECHTVFGAVDGYGLYPFTKQSLWNAASRADTSMPRRLNPRVLQNDLLVEVLDNFAPEIVTGRFPPYKLLEKLEGITSLPPVAQAELRNRNPQIFERWAAFLELYDGTGKIINLDERLRAAFEVPEIPGADAADASTSGEEAIIDEPSTQLSPTSKEDLLIEQWLSGDGFDQTLVNKLRLLVFSAISNAIDWDMIGLAKSSFSGTTGKPFQRASISFDRQTTQVRSDLQVKIVIQANPKEASALQGLLRASKDKFRWDFADGDKMLGAFLDCLEIWASSVEDQLQAICRPTPQWNQAAAAIELLCVGAALGGKIKPDATIAEMIDGAFNSNWLGECASSAPEMKSLYDRLSKNRKKFAEIARSQTSSMKGGRAGAMLNPGRILDPIRKFRKAKWQLRLQPPEGDVREPANTYREIWNTIGNAAASEMAFRQSWFDKMEAAFGTEATRASILEALNVAHLTVHEAGIGTSGTGPRLADALDRFSSVQFDDSMSSARALGKESDAIAALPHFGRGRRGAVEAGAALAEVAKAFLDTIDQNLASGNESLEAKHSELGASLKQIDKSLSAIEADLLALSVVDREDADAS